MIAVRGEFVGLKEANKALRQLPDFAKAEAQHVIDVTAFQVAGGATARARRRTGLLIASIQWQSRPRSLSAIVGIAKEAYYWKFLEYGTVKMPPSRFLRPAADAQRGDHLARMEQALERANRQVEQAAR